jgi:hypothetical protein
MDGVAIRTGPGRAAGAYHYVVPGALDELAAWLG